MLKSDESLSAVFKCLGEPARRAMLVQLSHGDATLGQLVEPLAISLPGGQQHLAVLEKAGLIACEKRGRQRWASLEPAGFVPAQEWLADRRRLWEARLTMLDRYLAAEPSILDPDHK